MLHIFAKNKPVMDYNNERLEKIKRPWYVLETQDKYPENVPKHRIETVLSKGRSHTGGLDGKIHIKD